MATGLVILRGNVRIEQEELRISAPVIVYDAARGVAVADRGASVRQGNRSIEARWARYDIPHRELLFYTAVQYRDDTLQLWTDSLRYYRLTDAAEAWGGLYLESPYHRIAAEADTLFYEPSRGYVALLGAVTARLHGTDTASSDTIWLTAAAAYLYRHSELQLLQAVDSVTLVRDTLWAARADSLVWDNSSGLVRLYGAPMLWYSSAEMTGDSIVVHQSGGQLQQLFCFQQARLRIRTDFPPRTHQLRADTIVLSRDGDTLTYLRALGSARSLYCHRTAEGTPDGLFRHSADRIELLFTSDSLREARWLGSVYGEYVPENLVGANFAAWSLPGLHWQRERPLLPRWRFRPRWLP
jgi:lipopolysaccharide export system protein LptA